MLSAIDFPESDEYRTGTENEPVRFYLESLMESNRLDLLLGYFSSSAIRVLSVGFAKFISNGGRVRLIINHILSAQDKAAVVAGMSPDTDPSAFSPDDFRQLRETLDDYGAHFFACLAWLIASGRVQIRAIRPIGRRGISHYKSGVFYDERDNDPPLRVKFKGSCNFTASGLLENLEELDIRRSWVAGPDAFTDYENEYNRLFNGLADYAELISFEQIEAVIVRNYGGKDLDELLTDEHRLATQQAKLIQNEAYQRIVTKLVQQIETYRTTPRFPYDRGPRDYQKEAAQNWVANGYKGIFAMATGTGKTITSLNCVLNEYQKTGQYQAVILVPTTVLVEQWTHEARKFNLREIITVSAKSKS